jgi:hypothetical protein
MASPKYDGVVEAVHYTQDGKVGWVRVYERRGPTFSDRIVLDRTTFVERLKAGRKYVAGKRIPLKASTFETSVPIRLLQDGGESILVTGDQKSTRDNLEGVGII